MHSFTRTVLLAVSAFAPAAGRNNRPSYTVTVVPPEHGKVESKPALPADGKYPAGTVVTVTTTPERLRARFGLVLGPRPVRPDSHEGMTPNSRSRSIATSGSARRSSTRRR